MYDLHTNNAHEDIIALHLSGALTAKAKNANGVRPLVSGSVHKRVLTRSILRQCKDRIIEILGEHQYGMAQKAAAENYSDTSKQLPTPTTTTP